ncbi:carboxypeptidase regulatory-like domain-containing protein [Micromonospora sp. STR1s_5]|nr:carboxypeptidase regulatory-like domain-containing protein [Micromonospora sp. STR1s_5]
MRTWMLSASVLALTLACSVVPVAVSAQQSSTTSVEIGQTDLMGVVQGPSGPEAGVWVIAETTDLPTRYTKVVVTDDQGRFMIPDLPSAKYKVWVRGYGLADSAKVDTLPGQRLDLKVAAAASLAEAAKNYPPLYWFALMHVPAKSEFPLEKIKSQGEWLNIVKSGACQSCHALGTPGTRTSRRSSESSRRLRTLGSGASCRAARWR